MTTHQPKPNVTFHNLVFLVLKRREKNFSLVLSSLFISREDWKISQSSFPGDLENWIFIFNLEVGVKGTAAWIKVEKPAEVSQLILHLICQSQKPCVTTHQSFKDWASAWQIKDEKFLSWWWWRRALDSLGFWNVNMTKSLRELRFCLSFPFSPDTEAENLTAHFRP